MNSPPAFLCPVGFVGGWGWVSNFNKLYFAAKTVMSFVPNVYFVITLWLCNVAFQGNSSPLKLQVYSMFALPGGCVTWLCLSTKPCDDHVSFRHKNRVGKGNLPIRSHLEPITSLKSTKKKNENVFCLSYWLHCVELKWPNASIARKEMLTFKTLRAHSHRGNTTSSTTLGGNLDTTWVWITARLGATYNTTWSRLQDRELYKWPIRAYQLCVRRRGLAV